MIQKYAIYSIAPVMLAISAASFAGNFVRPDAGRTLQEITPPKALPEPSLDIDIQSPETKPAVEGGAQITVKSISIKGNSIYDQATLLALIGDFAGKSYDLAGLKKLANIITEHYRKNGYPFARAVIPAQKLDNGDITIEVVEGRYGDIKVNGTDKQSAGAQKFMDVLKSGDVIESKKLERATLILDDQPGYSVTPVITPSEKIGAGDLDVSVTRDKKYYGEVGLDNYGNRYTGRTRGHIELVADSPLMFGDQIRLNTIYTEENTWFGFLKYNLPIGGSGLRANIGYTHTYYELGKEFASLDANGTAKVTTLGLSYPIIRSQNSNLTIAANYQYKRLNDQTDAVDASFNKYSHSLPITLSFDVKDQLGLGGITYGNVTWTHGTLNLDSELTALDRLTAKTEGDFDKLNIDIARIQALPAQFNLLGRLSMQATNGNLDSSEKFGLGGVNGVRAYPSGEGFGDEGAFAKVELSYVGNTLFNPYAFYDVGSVKINHNTFDDSKNRRSVSGTGFGVRLEKNKWSGDASVAWRLSGGRPLSDTKNEVPMMWLGGKYKF
ncbi:MAG TPA: ShlB/FhaC/HecB family hemolysin secretion/activation protein [Methylophilus sp.]